MDTGNLFRGIILIVLGCYFLLKEFTTFDLGRFFWPTILIIIGVFLLFRNQIKSKNHSNS